MDCCTEHARASAGLPAIEPGMPEPAGTGLSRRSLLLRSAGLGLAVYGAGKLTSLPGFETGVAAAQGAGPNTVLLSVFMDGGVDSLSLLAPVGDAAYRRLRPSLAVGGGREFAEDPRLHWHPAASALADLHAEGKVSVLPAVGYTDADQSHFTSRHFYEIGELEIGARTGWLGRYLDRNGNDDNPLQGLSLDGTLSPSLATSDKPVAAVSDVTDYDMWTHGMGDPVEPRMFEAFGNFGGFPSDSAGMTHARRATAQTEQLRQDLSSFSNFPIPAGYPNNSFARKLAGIAEMLARGMPLSCISVSAPGGYDTHSSQEDTFATNLGRTCDAVLAFQRDLEQKGLADVVLTEMWSEFGRRPDENGSAGTDHGAGGCAFIVGSRAQGEMVGEFPGLASLDEDDNLLWTADFRAMYAALIDQWLEDDPEAIIPDLSEAGAIPTLVKSTP